MSGTKQMEITITGIVQGVGFRPFVYRTAVSLTITGYVINNAKGVKIIAAGTETQLSTFIDRLKNDHPPAAIIDSLTSIEQSTGKTYPDFTIKQSQKGDDIRAGISTDLMLCPDCMREMLDPTDRRYYYPFINCTNCGPRYTIIKGVPYDRPLTTMRNFTMCPACRAEYSDPLNRRFHAQPNACHTCGPHMTLYNNEQIPVLEADTPDTNKALITRCAELIQQGAIIAVKGIGGYHIVCSALHEETVAQLRHRKFREYKPFAVMMKDIEQVKTVCAVDSHEAALLRHNARPIVLLEKKEDAPIDLAPGIAPSNKYLGVMLPYTPVHYLLFEILDIPLVMTSANISDEPIAYLNSDAFSRLKDICDYYLVNNRDIHIRCDDSVVRVHDERPYLYRRSRGYVPAAVKLAHPLPDHILAVGAELKNTVCLGKDNRAILSHHIGDLKNLQTFKSFKESIKHLAAAYDIHPAVIAHDLHPQYLSTGFAREIPYEFFFLYEAKVVGIQHHHAHAVSCMVDNDLTGEVIAVILDGSGYGPDNTIWGGEIMTVTDSAYTRRGALKPFRLPGGESAIKQVWKIALSLAGQRAADLFTDIDSKEVKIVDYQLTNQQMTPLTTSCGRLFDGAAALAGVRPRVFYEGQAAVEFEQLITDIDHRGYTYTIEEKNNFYSINWQPMIDEIIADRRSSTPVGHIAYKFHRGLAMILTEVCERIRRDRGLDRVVLSGGCFMNMYLLQTLSDALCHTGFSVYTHSRVPCNDGGLSLGQLAIAAAAK